MTRSTCRLVKLNVNHSVAVINTLTRTFQVQWNGWFERASVKVFVTNAKVDAALFATKGDDWDAARAEERVRLIKRRLVVAALRGFHVEEADVLMRQSWGEKVAARVLACTSVEVDGCYLAVSDTAGLLSGEPCKAALRLRRVFISANDAPNVGVARMQKCVEVEGCLLTFGTRRLDEWKEEEILNCEGVHGWLDVGGDEAVRVGAKAEAVDLRNLCMKKLLILRSAIRSYSRFQEFVLSQSALQRSRSAGPGRRFYSIARHIVRMNARNRVKMLSPEHFGEVQSLYLTCLERKASGSIAPVLQEWLDEFELLCPTSVLVDLCKTERFYAQRKQGGSSGWRERAYAFLLQEDQTALKKASVSHCLKRQNSQAEGILEVPDVRVELSSSSKIKAACFRIGGRCIVSSEVDFEISHVSVNSTTNEQLFAANRRDTEGDVGEEVFFDAAEEALADTGEEEDAERDVSDIQAQPSVARISIDTIRQRLHLKLQYCDILLSPGLCADVLQAWSSEESSNTWSTDVTGTDLLLGFTDSPGSVGYLLCLDHLELNSGRLVLKQTSAFVQAQNAALVRRFNGSEITFSEVSTIASVSLYTDKTGCWVADFVEPVSLSLDPRRLLNVSNQLSTIKSRLSDRGTGMRMCSTGTCVRIRMDLLRAFGITLTGSTVEIMADGGVSASVQTISGRVRSQAVTTDEPVVSIQTEAGAVEVSFSDEVEVDVTEDSIMPFGETDNEQGVVKSIAVQCPSMRFLWPSDHVSLHVTDILVHHDIVDSTLGMHIGSMAIIDMTTGGVASVVKGVEVKDAKYDVGFVSLTDMKAVDLLQILQQTIPDIGSTSFRLCIQRMDINLPIVSLHAMEAILQSHPATSEHAYELSMSEPELTIQLHPCHITCGKGDVRVVADLVQQEVQVRLPSIEVNMIQSADTSSESTIAALPDLGITVLVDAVAVVAPDNRYRSSTSHFTVALNRDDEESTVIAEATEVAVELGSQTGTWEQILREAHATLRIVLCNEKDRFVANEVDVNVERLRICLQQRSDIVSSCSTSSIGTLASRLTNARLNIELNDGELNVALGDGVNANVQFTAHGHARCNDVELESSLSVSTSILLNKDHRSYLSNSQGFADVESGIDRDGASVEHETLGKSTTRPKDSAARSGKVLMDWSEFMVDSIYNLKDPSRANVFRISMTSDTDLHVTPQDLALLKQCAESQRNPTEPHISKDLNRSYNYAVTFTEETLGLKLGPCETPPFALEIRGYSKGCPESISHRIGIGDRIAQVNETSLYGLSSTNAAEVIRNTRRPCVLAFATRDTGKQQALASVGQYLPVYADAYVCEFCGAVVGFKHGDLAMAGTKDTCVLCGGEHVKVGSGEDSRSVVKEEEAFENQRFYRISGWSQDVLPSDGFSWSNRERTKSTTLASFSLPASHSPGKRWTWLEEWKLDRTQGNNDGWTYGRDFDQMGPRPSPSTSVRRRRWTRRRALVATAATQQRDLGGLQTMFTTGRFRLGLVLSCQNNQEAIPLCRVSLAQTTVRMAVLSGSSRIAANALLGVEMRNGRVGKWEPLLEPWETIFESTEMEGSRAVTLLGTTSLSVNFSTDFVLTMERFIRVLNKEADASIMSPVVVVNNTGCLMSVWKEGSDAPPVELQPKARMSLSDLAKGEAFGSPLLALGVELFGGWKAIRRLPIASGRLWALALASRSPASIQRPTVFVEVATQQFGRSVTVLAPFSFCNLTASPIICVVTTKSERTILIGPIQHAQSAPIPFDIIDVLSVTVSVADGHRQQQGDLCKVNLEDLKTIVNQQLSADQEHHHDIVVEQLKYEAAVSGQDVVTSVHARAVEQCHLAEQLVPTFGEQRLKTRRAILGQPFTAQVLTLSFHARLSFTNRLPIDLDLQLQSPDHGLPDHIRIASSETWPLLAHVSSADIRFRMRCNALSDAWSDWWDPIDRPKRVFLYDTRKRRICIAIQWQAMHERGVATASFSCGTWVQNSTTFPLEFSVIRSDQPRDVATARFEQLPSLFEISADEVQQSERWTPLGGWGAPSLPRDPPEWGLLGSESIQEIKALDALFPEKGWSYVDKTWQLLDDWTYAVDFTAVEWGLQERSFHCVRKRCWRRVTQRDVLYDSKRSPIGDDVRAFKVRIGSAAWSSEVEVNSDTGGGRDVEVSFGSGVVVLHVVYRRIVGQHESLVMDLRPRFAIENKTLHKLHLHQYGTNEDGGVLTPSGQVCCWTWSSKAQTRMLRIRLDDLWTGPLDLNLLDTVPVTLRDMKGRIRELLSLRTESRTEGALTNVVITPEKFPGSILVENRTETEVVVTQKTHARWGLQYPGLTVKSLRVVPLGWDCIALDSPPEVVVRLSNGEFLTVDINRTAEGVIASSQHVDVIVYSKGSVASHVLCLVSKGRLVRGLRPNQSGPVFHARLELSHVCVSVIDGTPVPGEQLLLHLANVQFSRRLDHVVDEMALTIEGVQLDDAVRRTRWPVVAKVSAESTSKRRCVVDVVATRLVGASDGLRFRSLSIFIQPAVVRMTRHLFKYLQGLMRWVLACFSQWKAVYDVSVDALHVQPLTLVLTLSSNETTRLMEDSKGLAEDGFESVQTEISVQSVAESAMLRVMPTRELPYWASALEHLLGTDVVDKVVKFPAMFAVNLSTSSVASLQTVCKHYRDAFVAGLALGAFHRQPADLGPGFMNMKGTIRSISGTSETITKSLARALTTFSLSNEYITKRQQSEQQMANRYDSLHESVAHGASMFSEGIGDAVKGIVLDPYRGAQKGGAIGFMEGIGKGMLGVAVKPAIGMLDLASNTAKGFKDQATLAHREVSILTSLYPEAARVLQLEDGLDTLVRPARPFYGKSRQTKAYRLEDALVCHFLENNVILELGEAFCGAFIYKVTQNPDEPKVKDQSGHGLKSVYVITSVRVLFFETESVNLDLSGEADEKFRLKHIVSCSIQRTATDIVGVQVEHSEDGTERDLTFMRCADDDKARNLFDLLHDVLLYNF